MSRLLMCLIAFLAFSLVACFPPPRHYGPGPDPHYRHQGSHQYQGGHHGPRPCTNQCVRWADREHCDGHGRCYPQRYCADYACR
jgi:hypothetical protein